ncbi:MAG: collagen binding domain-containing protein [Hyphomicrobiales bacterium]
MKRLVIIVCAFIFISLNSCFKKEPLALSNVIVKVELKSNPVSKAKIHLYDSSNNEIGRDETDKDGKLSFSELLPGSYTIKASRTFVLDDGKEHIGKAEKTTSISEGENNITLNISF